MGPCANRRTREVAAGPAPMRPCALSQARGNADDDCRAELSFPDQIEDQIIVSWAERIFIPDDEDESASGTSDGDDLDFDVPVRRKG